MAPGGRLVITDYARGKTPGSPEFERYIEKTGYSVIEPEQYGELLKAAGFVDVVVDDATAKFVEILRSEADSLVARRAEFLASFSEADLDYLVDRWDMKIGFCQAGDMKWGIYVADQAGLKRVSGGGSVLRLAGAGCTRPAPRVARTDRLRPDVESPSAGLREASIRDPTIRAMPPTPDPTDDSRDLAAFGYRPVLNRTLGGFSSFAAGFSYISILTGVFQMFYVGYGAGGPAFFWTWPAVFLGQLTVAPLLRRAGGAVSAVGRGLPVVAADRRPRGRLDGRLGLPVRLGHLAGRRRAGAAGHAAADLAGVPTGRRSGGEGGHAPATR